MVERGSFSTWSTMLQLGAWCSDVVPNRNVALFYVICIGFIEVLLAYWLYRCVKWWRELFAIHTCIGVVIFMGLGETFLWYDLIGSRGV